MKSPSLFVKIMRFVFLLILINAIGYIATEYMTTDTITWYHTLPLSALNPPDYIFGIVWSILLFLQAIAAVLVWGKASFRGFILQLSLNTLWSFIFFKLRRPDFALVITILFICALIINIKEFGQINKIAGWLIVPTLLWALFALYLNTVIIF